MFIFFIIGCAEAPDPKHSSSLIIIPHIHQVKNCKYNYSDDKKIVEKKLRQAYNNGIASGQKQIKQCLKACNVECLDYCKTQDLNDQLCFGSCERERANCLALCDTSKDRE